MLAKGWTANISVQGDRGMYALHEHQVVVTENSATCFVESESGKIFEVSLLQGPRAQHDITAKVFLDGEAKRSVSRVMKKQERATKMLGRRFSPTEVRPFQFRTITTTEQDANSLAPQQEAPSDFGSIFIKIYRGKAGTHGLYQSNDREDPSTTFDELSVKKKQTTEVAGLSAIPVPTVPASVRNFHYLDHPHGPPFFEFKFVYKSRSLLLALGIIKPGSSSRSSANKVKPEPSSFKKKVGIIEILSSEEEEEESQQVKDAKAAVAIAKKEAVHAEEALKEAKEQHRNSTGPKKRVPDTPLTSILKKPKVEKG